MSEEVKVGEIVKFFAKPSVAAIKVTEGIKVGDELHYRGATTDFTEVVESMEVDNKKVAEAATGSLVGIKVGERVRPGDTVLKTS
ncbi:MAG: translation elongation factor-like protein [Deltaproteobacteria bacterium]|uniref:Translation elongation factor-like protein n=1 Tax=Candidatus Zymogenus saltonus TaxID=2844893 RepID=A0A9D8KDT5_9DELT|nr:translation elongation factor-like protein [Candidatus Zymogenus saltonus]